ncbi:hypothetical protein CJO74_14265 [Ralstonia solanacearum]|nr:hypothetical protein CJO74_14265 [Ralstonia solanacearum]
MANEKRIANLQTYVSQWTSWLAELTAQRTALLNMQSEGYCLSDEAGDDYLQRKIAGIDAAVLEHQDILTRMQSLLVRAQAGEDV